MQEPARNQGNELFEKLEAKAYQEFLKLRILIFVSTRILLATFCPNQKLKPEVIS